MNNLGDGISGGVLSVAGPAMRRHSGILFEFFVRTAATLAQMPESQRRISDVGKNPAASRAIFLSSLGEIVEWFDFMVYLSLAPILAKVFFPPASRSSLLLTLGIFGAAFLARPIGAVLFGHLGDRFGRKRALVLSALLMALAKLVEGLLPAYTTAGYLAPAFFLLARIASGFSLGGEFTGTTVMLFESARVGRRGLTTSLANVMGGIGVFLASALVGILTTNLSAVAMQSWGWRVPFFAGSLIGLGRECRKRRFSKNCSARERRCARRCARAYDGSRERYF